MSRNRFAQDRGLVARMLLAMLLIALLYPGTVVAFLGYPPPSTVREAARVGRGTMGA